MLKLYWATTEDHDEDWFIVASSAKGAARLHENLEGYESGYATAEFVMDIPESLAAEKGWPPEELLLGLGAKFVGDDPTRVVEIAGRKFCEGLLEGTILTLHDDRFENLGQGRPNQTKRTDFRKH